MASIKRRQDGKMSLFEWRGYSIPALFLIVLIILTGLATILLKPVWSLENQRDINIEKRYLYDAVDFCRINHPRYQFLRIYNKYGNVILKYLSADGRSNIESETIGFTAFESIFYVTEDNAWFTLKDKDNNSWIVKAFDDDGNPNIQKKIFHKNPWNGKLLIDYTSFGENIKIDCGVFKNMGSDYEIIKREDITFIKFSESFFSTLLTTNYPDVDESESFKELAKELSVFSDYNFSNRDIFQIITDKQRANWYKQTLNTERGKGFFKGNIIAYSDFDRTGRKDFLIFVSGNRYLPSYLYRYNPEEEEVVWCQPLYFGLDEVEIKDIDDDGYKEIIIGGYANGSGCSVDVFDNEISYANNRSGVLILDSNGKVKKYNGKEAFLDTGRFTTKAVFSITENGKIFIAPTFPNVGNKTQKLLLADFKNNRIDTLNIDYDHAFAFYKSGNIHDFFHEGNGYLYKSSINNKGDLISQDSLYTENSIKLSNKKMFRFDGKSYYILHPFTILNDNLNKIYEEDNLQLIKVIQSGNEYYVSAVESRNNYKFYKLLISKNTKLNKFYILIWIFTLIVLIVYFITSFWFSIPQQSIEGSYAVLYSLLGFLYNWRIFGKTSVYMQPVIASFSKKRFYDSIKDISENYHEVSDKKLGIVKLQVFKLNIDNEMHIVQRIAHDIKNKLHLVNIQMQEEPFVSGKFSAEFMESKKNINYALQEIFNKTSMLSNFSRVNLLRITTCDLITIIDDLLIRYSGHPRLKDLNWDPEMNILLIKGDEVLIQTAVMNVIENAIKYSPDGTRVDIFVKEQDSFAVLTVKNKKSCCPAVHESQKENGFINYGSGIGLMITEKIMKSHDSKLNFIIKDSIAVVEMFFNKSNNT